MKPSRLFRSQAFRVILAILPGFAAGIGIAANQTFGRWLNVTLELVLPWVLVIAAVCCTAAILWRSGSRLAVAQRAYLATALSAFTMGVAWFGWMMVLAVIVLNEM